MIHRRVQWRRNRKVDFSFEASFPKKVHGTKLVESGTTNQACHLPLKSPNLKMLVFDITKQFKELNYYTQRFGIPCAWATMKHPT